MLQAADILILDEPTNDLDIPTLEVLEETLLSFPGVLVLVTHDRFLLDSVSTQILALDGNGGAQFFSGVAQWETWTRDRKTPSRASGVTVKSNASSSSSNSKPSAPNTLSSSEKRELERIEAKIEQADAKASEIESSLITPAIASDAVKLREGWDALEEARGGNHTALHALGRVRVQTRWLTCRLLNMVPQRDFRNLR